MKIYRKALILALSVILAAVSALSLSGCGEEKSSAKSGTESGAAAATGDEAQAAAGLAELGIDPQLAGVQPEVRHDEKNAAGFQLKDPQDGDTIAVIHTSAGDITLRFFPEQAPKTVTNFINLAKNGSYNNTTFDKVLDNCLIQGGDSGSDAGNPNGVSSFGAPFEDEFCDSLFNFRGAVSMANTAKDSNGSRFIINQTQAVAFRSNGGWDSLAKKWENFAAKLKDYKDSNLLSAYIDENGDKLLNPAAVPQEVKALYERNGGNPTLDGVYNAVDRGCTVFAQVIDGMDTVDKIVAVEVDENDVPKKPVTIKSVEITTYKAK